MQSRPTPKLYVPAMLIVLIVLILLVFIGISTYHNLNRDRKNALDVLHRQGMGVCAFIKPFIKRKTPDTGLTDGIKNAVREIVASKTIDYIYILDHDNAVVLSETGPQYTAQKNLPDVSNEGSRIRQHRNGTKIYELVQRAAKTSRYRIVIGINMMSFETARVSDMHHAIIMMMIVVVLGGGALFFIFVIQNYYQVNKTLRQTQDYMREVVANMANGLLSVDQTGKIVSFNNLALKLLGLSQTDVHTKKIHDIIDITAIDIAETLTHNVSFLDREIMHYNACGERIFLSLSITPFIDQVSGETAAVIVIRDLTEIKRLEHEIRRSEKMAAIGEIAAGIAHEIRNPLSSIRGFAHFMRHSLKDHPQEREYAEIMVKEIDRINRVVSDLLTFAKPLTLDAVLTDIQRVIEDTLRLVQADAAAASIMFELDIAPNLPPFRIDPNLMTHALLNLFLNALQIIISDGTVIIGARQLGQDNVIWVEDDGPGISDEIREKIFDPYFTRRRGGSGLGLSIVNKIIENHNGGITIESPPPNKQRGTRFTITLPAT